MPGSEHCCISIISATKLHDDVIKWKHFPRYWPFVRGIHRPPVNSPHKGQWRGALIFSLICAWINDWVNNRKTGDLRRHSSHCEVIVILTASETNGMPTRRKWYILQLKQYMLNSLVRGRPECNFKTYFAILFYWLASSDVVKPSGKCHGISLMTIQHWFR